MGFSISWLAFRNIAESDMFARAGFRRTEISCEAFTAPVTEAILRDNWHLIAFNRISHALTKTENLTVLSQGCEIVGVQAEEHVMASAAFLYRNGQYVWEVAHEHENGNRHLLVMGTPPDSLDEIRERLEREQDKSQRGPLPVNYIFDIPIELAERICGFRHDRWGFDWESRPFVVSNRSSSF